MTPADFDRRHGKGAFARLRGMLNDPALSYEKIGNELRLTKQRVAVLAKELGIDGRGRWHKRTLTREPRIRKPDYLRVVAAVIEKIKSCGNQVLPYNMDQANTRDLLRSRRMVIVNGVLCSIQVQPARKLRPDGRKYAYFIVGERMRQAKAAIFAMRGGTKKLYVIPTAHLRNVLSFYIPADGKYAIGTGKNPRKDWTVYRDAWHLLQKL